ncbi:hypothetical protein M405DRAFT_747828, partial [Rhizopogon salebrosus TDB-379]
HNPEIDWNAGKVNLNRCPEKCDKKEVKTVEQMVPEWLHDYLSVFQEEDSKQVPG